VLPCAFLSADPQWMTLGSIHGGAAVGGGDALRLQSVSFSSRPVPRPPMRAVLCDLRDFGSQAAPNTPHLANMLEGGKTPILPPAELKVQVATSVPLSIHSHCVAAFAMPQ